MCGIIGIASNKPVSINIINSLKKLEYRGYDSAGIATLKNNFINEKKCSGRVDELEKIPSVGDAFRWNGLLIEVVDMDGRRIDRLLVQRVSTDSK